MLRISRYNLRFSGRVCQEVNEALEFDREQAKGMRLDIPAGTAVRFELGDKREVVLVPFVDSRQVYGFQPKINRQLPAT